MKHLITAASLAALMCVSNAAYAKDNHAHHNHAHHNHATIPAAPPSIMGDHLHGAGDFMVSYRYMRMDMAGNRDGTRRLSPVDIATTVPNRFAGTAGQQPTLRVVPTQMDMDMHMFGAMYGVTDHITVMAIVPYIEKNMDHITFAGGAGTAQLGRFTTKSKGIGDVKISGLFGVYADKAHSVHIGVGVSLPTGATDKTDHVLAPNGMTPRLRLPYAMQLGSGTYDFLPALTYTGHNGAYSWGAQYSGVIRLENENSNGYALGDKHGVNVWGGYAWSDALSTTARIGANTQGKIDGNDPNIVAPVQTADPDNYGGDIVDVGLGVTFKPQNNIFNGHEFAAEISAPLYRDLNGPQLEADMTITAGWKVTF